MVGWSPDSWVGLTGTTTSFPWKYSLNKRTRFGLFVRNLAVWFCIVSSTYLEQIWLTVTQKAAVQHVCVCISVQEIPGRNMTNSSWHLPSVYKHYGEIHRLTRSKVSGLRRCPPALYVISKCGVGWSLSCFEICQCHTLWWTIALYVHLLFRIFLKYLEDKPLNSVVTN